MKDEQNPFDKKIRSALESLPEYTPPAGGWDILKKHLQNEEVLKKRKRRYFFFILITGAALSLALWLIYPRKEGKLISSAPAKTAVQEINDEKINAVQPDSTAPEHAVQKSSGKQDPVQPDAVKTPGSGIIENRSSPVQRNDVAGSNEKDLAVNESALVIPEKLDRTDVRMEIPAEGINSNMEHSESGLNKSNKPENPEPVSSMITGEKAAGFNTLNPETAVSDEPVPVALEIDSAIPPEAIADTAKDTISMVSQDTVKKDSVMVIALIAQKNRSAWIVGIYGAPDINRYRLKNENTFGDEIVSSGYDLKGSKNFQTTFGFIIGYLWREKYEISTAVRYSQKRKLATGISKIGSVPSDSSYYNYTYDFRGRYLQFPVQFIYIRKIQKIDFTFSVGVVAAFNRPVKDHDYFIRESVDATGMRSEKVNLEPASMGISSIIGAGIRYPVNDNLRLFLEPSWQYSFNPVIKHPFYRDVPVNHFINTMSIGAGITYLFYSRQR